MFVTIVQIKLKSNEEGKNYNNLSRTLRAKKTKQKGFKGGKNPLLEENTVLSNSPQDPHEALQYRITENRD